MASLAEEPSIHRKIALIICNRNYRRSNTQLNHLIHNAEALRDQLKNINFKITMKTDVVGDIGMVIKDFVKTIQPNDLVLVYYFGFSCHVNNKNYVISVGDEQNEVDINVENNANDVQRILSRLVPENAKHTTILVLDCCRPFTLRSTAMPDVRVTGNGLLDMPRYPGAFIQFACSDNETADDDLFFEHLLTNISQENLPVIDLFQQIADEVYSERHEVQQPLSIDGLSDLGFVSFNKVNTFLPNIPSTAIWKSSARTLIGGWGPNSPMDRLHSPQGLWISNNQRLLIADSSNHRIMSYNLNTQVSRRIAGKNIQGYGPDLLAKPSNVVFHKQSKSYIICDAHNRRVLQWFPRSRKCARSLVNNIACFGLAVDNKGFIYVSDTERHQVKRYRIGEKRGIVVAGGNGQGSRRKQLNHPTYICIGDNQSVYVSDCWNDRVVRWDKGKEEGVIVAGGRRKGKDRNQLDCPAGLLIDRWGTLYVADHWNHRVMRYRMGKEPDMIAGDRFLPGSDRNKLICPEGLAFDHAGNLYVADSNNHRIQRFQIQQS